MNIENEILISFDNIYYKTKINKSNSKMYYTTKYRVIFFIVT